MLVLSRKVNERIVITSPEGVKITLMLIEVRGDKARIGVEAPIEYRVNRGEVQDVIDAERLNADDPRHPDFGRDYA